MNCVWFEMRLDELLDNRLPPDSDAELNEHAEACPHCARLLADHQALLEAIDVLVGPETRGGLAARVLAEVTLEPVSLASVSRPAETARPAGGAQRAPLRAATWIAATVAAAMLVGLGVMERGMVHRAGGVAESKVPDLDLRNVAVEKPAVNAVADNRDPHTTRSVAEVHSLANLLGPQQRTLMEQMTDGLRPVTHSMSAAINALRRTLPGSETPARSS